MKTVIKLVKEWEDRTKGKVFFLCPTGSRLHGTETTESDLDIKGVYIPNMDNILLGKEEKTYQLKTNKSGEKNSSEDIDIELISLNNFFRLIGRGEINTIELMMAMKSETNRIKPVIKTEFSDLIAKNSDKLIVNKVMSFVGFAMNQASKNIVKGERLIELESVIEFLESFQFSKTAAKKTKLSDLDGLYSLAENKKYIFFEGEYLFILNKMHHLHNSVYYTLNLLNKQLQGYGARAEAAKKNGVDWKATSHALRAILVGQEVLFHRRIEFPLKDRELLLNIKQGKTNIEVVSEKIEEELTRLYNLSEVTLMKTSIDMDLVDRLKLKILKNKLELSPKKSQS